MFFGNQPFDKKIPIYLYIYICMGGCQNYGPFLGTLNIRCRIIIGIQKGTVILTTTHMCVYVYMDIAAESLRLLLDSLYEL